MKNEHTSSTAPLLIGMAAGAALGAAGVMATNTSQRQMRRTARKIAKGAEHAVSQLDKMVGDFVEHKMEGRRPPHHAERPGQRVLPCPGLLLQQKSQQINLLALGPAELDKSELVRARPLHLACWHCVP